MGLQSNGKRNWGLGACVVENSANLWKVVWIEIWQIEQMLEGERFEALFGIWVEIRGEQPCGGKRPILRGEIYFISQVDSN
jgi:hypothetical protein